MAKVEQRLRKTLYHDYFCGDNVGEADGFFEIKDGKLQLVDCWSQNDAMWRHEYMNGILEWAGVDLKDLPDKYHDEAEKMLEKNWGLDYSGKSADGKPEYAQLVYREGTSDKVYNLNLATDETGNWFVAAEYGRRGGNLREETKCEAETYETAKKLYDKVLNEKLKKGYRHAD
jgi:predicted DNA-binding WGR domain protein